MDKKELAKFLYDNFYDKSNDVVDLSFLDFREYDCRVAIGHMAVAKDLFQGHQKAKEIYQGKSEARVIEQSQNKADCLWQCWCEAKILRMDNLKYYVKTDCDGDIITYERKKKMTQKDIEKALGYAIEIIEGEEEDD